MKSISSVTVLRINDYIQDVISEELSLPTIFYLNACTNNKTIKSSSLLSLTTTTSFPLFVTAILVFTIWN